MTEKLVFGSILAVVVAFAANDITQAASRKFQQVECAMEGANVCLLDAAK